MAIAHGLLKLLVCEVFRPAAGIEIVQAHIDRVGAVLHGGDDSLG